MMPFEKVLEVFADFLDGNKSYDVLQTSRGCMVVNWECCVQNDWVTGQLCRTPEFLRDILRFSYVDYQGYRITGGYQRDLTKQEEQDIGRMGMELAARCEEK